MLEGKTISELKASTDRRTLTSKEIKHFNSLPSIDSDPDFWRNCGDCSLKIEKHISYIECADCENLCLRTLTNILWSLHCNDLETEANESYLVGENPRYDASYRS